MGFQAGSPRKRSDAFAMPSAGGSLPGVGCTGGSLYPDAGRSCFGKRLGQWILRPIYQQQCGDGYLRRQRLARRASRTAGHSQPDRHGPCCLRQPDGRFDRHHSHVQRRGSERAGLRARYRTLPHHVQWRESAGDRARRIERVHALCAPSIDRDQRGLQQRRLERAARQLRLRG
jgi:hypothetical protein